jgi:putative Holliday junction resolvase
VAGLDLGTRRIGVAVSDELRMTVRPLGVIEARGPRPDARALREMLAGLDVGLLVAGVPLLPSGDEGPSAVRCRAQAADLARRLALPLAFVDESDTTLEAQRILSERPRRRSGGADAEVDALAAALLLEAWIADQGRLS